MKTSIAIRGAWLFSLLLCGVVAGSALAQDLPPPPLPPLPGESAAIDATPPLPPIPEPAAPASQATAATDLPPLPELNMPASGEKPLTPEAVLPSAIENAAKVPDAAPLPIPETPQVADVPPLPLPPTDSKETTKEVAKADVAVDASKATEEKPADKPKKKKKKKKKPKQNSQKEMPQLAGFSYHSQRVPLQLYRPEMNAKNKHLPRAQFDEQRQLLLLQMCAQNNANAVRALVEAGVDANTMDSQTGQTALHVAARYRATKVLAALLGRGANPNTQDNWGKTPLYYASQTGDADLVNLLVQAGASAQEYAALR